MRHASPATLDAIEPLLREIRRLDGLVEKKRGIWYRRSRGFLHFHEDPAGVFADLKTGDDYERFRVSTASERRAFVARLRRALEDASGGG
jgi:hypothetical protein